MTILPENTFHKVFQSPVQKYLLWKYTLKYNFFITDAAKILSPSKSSDPFRLRDKL